MSELTPRDAAIEELIGLWPSRSQAERVIEHLERGGFTVVRSETASDDLAAVAAIATTAEQLAEKVQRAVGEEGDVFDFAAPDRMAQAEELSRELLPLAEEVLAADVTSKLDAHCCLPSTVSNDGPAAMADGTVLGRRTAKSLGLASGENRDDTATWTPPAGVDLPSGWTGEGAVGVDRHVERLESKLAEAIAGHRRLQESIDIALIHRVVDARFNELADRFTNGRAAPTPDERVTRQQWDPGPQPSEYGDHRTEPEASS